MPGGAVTNWFEDTIMEDGTCISWVGSCYDLESLVEAPILWNTIDDLPSLAL